jgi:DNA-binding NarL/FixJ family response regulator
MKERGERRNAEVRSQKAPQWLEEVFAEVCASDPFRDRCRRAAEQALNSKRQIAVPTVREERNCVRVVLFSDEPILAKGLESVLASVDAFQLTGVYSNTAKLKEIPATDEPDILLIDLTSDVTLSILSELKEASLNAKIVLWVHSISTELALQAMALGVRGILRKTLPSELLVKCLQRVNTGEFWFEKALTDSFLSAKRIALTKREGQLVSLLSQGLKNQEIASMLLISNGTVKHYLSRLFQKVGVKDRFELALYGLRNLTTGHGTPGKATTAERSSIAEALPRQDLRALFLEKYSLRSSTDPSLNKYRKLRA